MPGNATTQLQASWTGLPIAFDTSVQFVCQRGQKFYDNLTQTAQLGGPVRARFDVPQRR